LLTVEFNKTGTELSRARKYAMTSDSISADPTTTGSRAAAGQPAGRP
jgi:hypothetical protein